MSTNADQSAQPGEPVGAATVPRPRGAGIPVEEFLRQAPTAAQPDNVSTPVSGLLPGPRPMRAGPLSRYLLVVVVVGLAAAVVWAVRGKDEVAVLVPAADLPAYHLIQESDVALDTVDAKEADGFAVLPLAGRFTTKPLKRGAPIRGEEVTTDVVARLGADVAVVGLRADQGDVLGGALAADTFIHVVLVERGTKTGEFDAVTLAVTPANADRTSWSLVVAMKAADASRLEAPLATSELSVIHSVTPGP
ncbi:SAF domain-containing protein [Asanoa iriomotensis]|uniref:SAF domain-containing protein n=1 Tax=Asanoa iriomotensis TaxID=234613 RepID=A0ABQ4BZX2_9ACTN|nr:SAF domain-containing protein [Asanoa iriomotensis]GIF56083.1 hypothetical protein Air01nite_21780 [Asanoa iriomotensis]